MQKIKVEVFHLAFLKLLLEDLFRIVFIGDRVSREFISKIETVSGIVLQYPSDDVLGGAAVIRPCRIIVVDAVLHGIVHHLGCKLLVYPAVFLDGKAHQTESQHGYIQVFEFSVDHVCLLLFLC